MQVLSPQKRLKTKVLDNIMRSCDFAHRLTVVGCASAYVSFSPIIRVVSAAENISFCGLYLQIFPRGLQVSIRLNVETRPNASEHQAEELSTELYRYCGFPGIMIRRVRARFYIKQMASMLSSNSRYLYL